MATDDNEISVNAGLFPASVTITEAVALSPLIVMFDCPAPNSAIADVVKYLPAGK
jgi:hypothetical protein